MIQDVRYRLSNQKIIGMSVICIFILLVFWVSFFLVTAYWTKFELEKRMKAEIQGDVRPFLFQPKFVLRNVKFIWNDRVRVTSGEVCIEYNAISLISGELLRVKIKGDGLQGELLGSWSEIEGVKQVKALTLSADLGFGRHGLREIHDVKVNSPTLKFQIQEEQPFTERRLQKATASI